MANGSAMPVWSYQARREIGTEIDALDVLSKNAQDYECKFQQAIEEYPYRYW